MLANVNQKPRGPRILAVVAVIALITVAGLGYFSIFNTKNSEIVGDASSPNNQDHQSVPQLELEEPILADDAPYAEIVHMAAGAWNEVATIVRTDQPHNDGSEPKSADRKRDAWIDGIQHQLQPVGRGLNNAFDFLWQAGKKPKS